MTDIQAAGNELPEDRGERIGVCFAGLGADSADAPQLRALLETAFISNGIDALDSPAEAAQGIGGIAVLPVPDPVRSLAGALHAGIAPQQALGDWMVRTQDLLQLCRRHRRQVLVLAAGPLLAGEEDSLELVATRLGLERTDAPVQGQDGPDQTGSDQMGVSSFSVLMAQGLLAATPEAQAQADELGALLAGPSGRAPGGMALIELAWQEAAQHETQEALWAGKISQLERDVQQAEANLIKARTQKTEAQEQAALLADSLGQATETNASVTAELELRQSELADLREMTESYVALLAEAEAAQKSLRADLRKVRAQAAAQDKTIQAFVADVDKLNKAQAKARQTAKTQEAAVQQLQDALEQAQAQSKGQAQQSTGTQRALMEERDLLSVSLQDLLAEAAKLEDKIAKLEGQVGDLRVTKALKRSAERQIASERARQRLREAVLGRTILDAETRLRDQGAAFAALQAQAQAQTQSHAALEDSLSRTETLLSKREKALKSAEKLRRAQKKLVAEAEQKLAEQAEQIEAMAAELTNIYGSKSWKVTGPMRKARSQLSTKKS